MKKGDIDLIVGASILIAGVILIGGVLWLKDVSVTRRMVDYAVLFPNVGTLQVGDPVMVNGVSKGSVKRISLRGDAVAVILDIDRTVSLTDSSRIAIQNIGLMGERGVGITYSGAGNMVYPVKSGDTLFLRGSFDTGIAEAIGMLGEVLGEVQALAGNVTSIVGQTVGDPAFIDLFGAIVARLDSLTIAAANLLDHNRENIDRSVANLQELSEQAKQLVGRNAPAIDSIVANGEALTKRALGVADNLDTLALSARAMLDRLQDDEYTIGKLLADKELYGDLRATMGALDSLVRNVQEDALKLRIKFGFGRAKN